MIFVHKVKLNSGGVFAPTEFLVEPIREPLSSYFSDKKYVKKSFFGGINTIRVIIDISKGGV